MNVGVLEDRWVSGARSVRWRDGDATRLVSALLLAVIFHLALATSVTEFLEDEPEPKPTPPKLEAPVLPEPTAASRDEAREEPDDEVVYYDEPLPTPSGGRVAAPDAFPSAAMVPPLMPTIAPPEPLPELADAPPALPGFEPIVQADPSALAIIPPDERPKPKVVKKLPTVATLELSVVLSDAGAVAALDSLAMMRVPEPALVEGGVTGVLSSSAAIGLSSGAGLEGRGGGTIGGQGLGLIGTGRGLGPDLADLESTYTRRIRSAVARVKSYPTDAEDEGLEGTVTIELTIDRGGTITAVAVARSSGHAVLDEAAVRSVRKLGRLPAPPAELHWHVERKVRIPVTYIYDE